MVLCYHGQGQGRALLHFWVYPRSYRIVCGYEILSETCGAANLVESMGLSLLGLTSLA